MKKIKGFMIGLAVGCVLMISLPSIAATVENYILVKSSYPIIVNNTLYVEAELPVLNYEGYTYIPLRAVGDLLGASVNWNSELKQAEIKYNDASDADPDGGNTAFRNIQVSGSGGTYIVSGEARVFEAMMHYAVSDGHNYLLEKSFMLNEGAPVWSEFELNIQIPTDRLPANGTLTLELFEYSANDGSRINEWIEALESFAPEL